MVEKHLLKLSKSHTQGSEFEVKWCIKNTACCLISDKLVTLHHLVNFQAEERKSQSPSIFNHNSQQPCLLKLILFDVRENKETDSREVCWPYSIKSIDINAQKKSIVILSESLLAEKDAFDKSLLFELSLDLMMTTEAIPSGAKSQNSKASEDESISITEAIEQFLASDFEISVDPNSKQNQSRLGMFKPTNLLKPFAGAFFGGQADQ